MHFDAQIIGIPDYGNLVRGLVGREEARYQVSKMRVARDEVVRLLGSDSSKATTALFRRKHAPVSHVYLERDSFLKPLRQWIARNAARFNAKTSSPPSPSTRVSTTSDSGLKPQAISSSSAVLKTITTSKTTSGGNFPTVSTSRSPFRAMEALGLNDALILPIDLPKPLSLELKGRAYRLPVVSARMLIEELDAMEPILGTGKIFILPKVPDFFCARATDIQRLARLEGLKDRFWVRFAAVVLRHLAAKSLETGLCAHITDRPVMPSASS